MDIGVSSYRRFLEGNDEAFVEIIKQYKDSLILYLGSITHDLDIAEDLMEDTFVRIITRKPVYHPTASFKAWLYAIARNIARDWYRKQTKYNTQSIDDISGLTTSDNVEQQYLRSEQKTQLYLALKKINPDYAQVLYFVYFEDFTNSQVAFVMKKSNRQVENLLYRAKRALRLELEKDGFIYERLS